MPNFTLCPTHTHEYYLSIGNIILKKEKLLKYPHARGKNKLISTLLLVIFQTNPVLHKGAEKVNIFHTLCSGKGSPDKGGANHIPYKIRGESSRNIQSFAHILTNWPKQPPTSSFPHSLKQP